ncbi:uncharacterized protein [Penaeus vannamei]|uniref:uncharacterized protein n=1 Tax=Penaeus vannamei TaxID=6689 RepID=UPI00387F7235
MREVILMILVFLTGGVFVQTAAGTGIYNYGPRDFMQSVFYLPYETTATLANRFDLVVVSLACVFQGLSLLSLSLGFHVVIGIVVIMTDVIISIFDIIVIIIVIIKSRIIFITIISHYYHFYNFFFILIISIISDNGVGNKNMNDNDD